MKSSLPSNKDAIIVKLIEEKLIQPAGTKYNITNLGGILFAKNLGDFENLSRKAVRVIIYKGKNRLETIKEQQGGKGYAIGFEGLINYINEKLPTNEAIGKAFRKEVKMYPEIAVRELVANALIHQDFSLTGTGPMVEIFMDRIEISNPGRPLIDTLRFIDHSPRSRNEKLTYFMRRINICEERGSGIDKVINAVEMYQLPAPNFVAEEDFLRVTLFAPKTLRQMDKDDKLRACYQHCCLKYVSNDFLTNQTLRNRLNVDASNYPMVSRIIADTAKANLIKDYDPENKSRKYAKYIPFWA
jgi:predicted HTH transcriptional regulator